MPRSNWLDSLIYIANDILATNNDVKSTINAEVANWRLLPLLSWSLALSPPLHQSLHLLSRKVNKLRVGLMHGEGISMQWRGLALAVRKVGVKARRPPVSRLWINGSGRRYEYTFRPVYFSGSKVKVYLL